MGKIRVAVAAALLAVAASTTTRAAPTFQEYFDNCERDQSGLRAQCPNKGCTEYVDAWCRRSANDQVTAEQAWKQQMSQPGPCGRDYNARQCCRSWHTQDGLLGACQLNDPIGAPSCARVDHFCAENHF